MWVRKWERDQKKGVDSPIPDSGALQRRIHSPSADERAEAVGNADRRAGRGKVQASSAWHAATSCGPRWAWRPPSSPRTWSTAPTGTSTRPRRWSPAATEEKWPKGEYFIMDVQTHFTDGLALELPRRRVHEEHGLPPQERRGCLQLSEVRQGDLLRQRDDDGASSPACPARRSTRIRRRARCSKAATLVEGRTVRRHPAELADVAVEETTQRTGPKPARSCQGNCAPNHYWDRKTNKQDLTALFEQMEREVHLYGIDSWKWYCHTDPGRSGNGFKLDDEKMTYPFYEKSKQLGHEEVQRAQGVCVAIANLGAPGQSGRHREGRQGPSRSDLHHLSLGHEARPGRAGLQEHVRSQHGRFRLARRS